ncbi:MULTISPECIES: hypothetical protein [unclassified Thermosynechococcus]|uniref:hypothetical protein n=1 Tax=unclassified Thermosynechococcus TaxID=2622553 RepID=UPI00267121DA|nr:MULTISPECIES: hypothetical protein [unclassified Thermosynechococcus]WKT82994.1 hypothetical protein QYC28_09180 [Thermosynechococcus sp. HY596]WNC62122.1 hypothetical protein RHK13_09175 [Thermosynechococcus sp. HY591]WNC64675.1 hypothetical protein RHK28_09205 [Thermosynechococcus sp. HY593]
MEHCSLSKKKEFAYGLRELALREKNPYQKAMLAEIYATYNIQNLVPIAEDLELEKDVLLSLSKSRFEPVIVNHDFVHVITETYVTGGHTRLLTATVEEQIKQNQDVAVLVTRAIDPQTLNFLEEIRCKVYRLEKQRQFFELVTKGKVISHIHHYDIHSAISLWFSKEKHYFDIYFVNHADHVFNYGHAICNSILEVSGYGYYRTEALKHYQSHHLVGIPLNISHLEKVKHKYKLQSNTQQSFNIMTIARVEKLRPAQGWNYPLFINQLLDECTNHKVIITIIGQSGKEDWWQQGYISEKNLEKVKLIEFVPYNNLYKNAYLYNAYLDSFPFTGGTVISEIATIGIPIHAPKLPCQGYSMADQIRSDSLEVVIQRLKDHIISGKLPYDTEHLSHEVQSFHHPTSYLERLMNVMYGREAKAPNELLDFKADTLFLGKCYATEWIQGLPELPCETSIINRVKLVIYSLKNTDMTLTISKSIRTILGNDHPIVRFLRFIKNIYKTLD